MNNVQEQNTVNMTQAISLLANTTQQPVAAITKKDVLAHEIFTLVQEGSCSKPWILKVKS